MVQILGVSSRIKGVLGVVHGNVSKRQKSIHVQIVSHLTRTVDPLGVNKFLLKVLKDQSPSTREENQLSYVTNPMNFRLKIPRPICAIGKGWPPLKIKGIAFSNFSFDLNNSSERLLSAATAAGVFATDIENQVTS
ncbi:hypothetical protein P691DRAFT_776984 [Macrolepiota fuliginosa MF-IS2]|uniref:Uncharacterized protein n=1 Tax=Macrolepiota fuliginosa MF-IS2 TaxID=1400762 RepID=A0A9P5X8X9_9AGAR|nr:hypothetical protein P691DRAFT_776984 [Macrolepiota fuliginosa MF-IS2]